MVERVKELEGKLAIAEKSCWIEKDNEPYFGWCDVKGCHSEGCSGGNAWNETGYWTVCSKHSQQNRDGKPQPEMKQSAIDRENSRTKDGYLPAGAILTEK
jgi:hypothetical protein